MIAATALLLALLEPASSPITAPAPEPVPSPPDRAEQQRLRRERDDARRTERLRRSFDQRALAGHPFVRPQFVASALPVSYFGLGLGAAGVLVRGADLATGEPRRSAYLAGLGSLHGGARITRWVGLSGGLRGVAGVGGSREAALDAGAGASVDWHMDAVVRVLHRQGTALSIGPELSGVSGRGLVLRPGFEYVLAKVAEYIDAAEAGRDVELDPRELDEVALRSVRKTGSLRGGARLAFAQGITRILGLQLAIAGGGQTQRLRYYDGAARSVRAAQGYLRTGAALSVQAGRLPIAIMLEYNALLAFGAGPARSSVSAAHDLGLGLFYNGLTQTIGIQAAASFVGPQATVGALFTLTTYF